MFKQEANQKGFSVKAWQGDAKTLLGFNFTAQADADNLAGFTIQVKPPGKDAYFLLNKLQLSPGNHAKDAQEPDNSSMNAPFQKFRWLHVPGLFHNVGNVSQGDYIYTVTPRYFSNGLLTAIDTSLSVSVTIPVVPFKLNDVTLGFTRGFTQSQAYANHFGTSGAFSPAQKTLLFNTSEVAGKNKAGQNFTYLDEYEWSGFTARDRIFEILNAAANDTTIHLDVFAYDLNEPDILQIFLKLAQEDRIRIILDDAALHTKAGAPEGQFETKFKEMAKDETTIKRGHFGRYAHDKIFIVYQNNKPVKVLSGSTNFSVTGMYVNSNHVIIFDNPDVAELYSQVFNRAWQLDVNEDFNATPLAQTPFPFNGNGLPKMSITFSPHKEAFTNQLLGDMATRIGQSKNVLFAVMDIASGKSPVFDTLQEIHQEQKIFSYGISDNPGKGITLYKPGAGGGLLIYAKPGKTTLPPPFDKEYAIGAFGHQIHHKFVICDFNTDQAVAYMGSSNLAGGGEKANGDNLIRIEDPDIAAAFAIEAVGLIDHFDFRDAHESGKPTPQKAPTAPKGGGNQAATAAGTAAPVASTLYLYGNDSWAKRYFNTGDLHCSDRILFGADV